MNVVLGCLLLVLGGCYTFFEKQARRLQRDLFPFQWGKDLLNSDLASLFFFLGGVGFIIAGAVFIFLGLTVA